MQTRKYAKLEGTVHIRLVHVSQLWLRFMRQELLIFCALHYGILLFDISILFIEYPVSVNASASFFKAFWISVLLGSALCST